MAVRSIERLGSAILGIENDAKHRTAKAFTARKQQNISVLAVLPFDCLVVTTKGSSQIVNILLARLMLEFVSTIIPKFVNLVNTVNSLGRQFSERAGQTDFFSNVNPFWPKRPSVSFSFLARYLSRRYSR